jgi:hypothetical protein
MTAGLIGGHEGPPLYSAEGSGALALVDGQSGSVLALVLADSVPNDATVTVSSAEARTATIARAAAAGYYPTGREVSDRLARSAGTAVYEVEWLAPGTGTPEFAVSVNPSTGQAFGLLDLRAQISTRLPVVGRGRASGLAIDALGISGETVLSAELGLDLPRSGMVGFAWTVALGIPTATQADVIESGGLISIDALTGAATIIKSPR